jgi:glycosyltransferase involved in cell wall biosynthesis
MKILIIKPILPYPPTQGTRRVTLNLIDSLRGRHDVTLLCKTLNDVEDSLVRELAVRCHKVVAVRAPNTRSFVHKVACKIFYILKSMITLAPLRAQYDCPGEIVRAARGLLAAEKYDVLLVEYWTMARTAVGSTARVNVLFEHDVDLIRNRERILSARGLFKKIRHLISWSLEKRGQLRAYPLFDSVITLTKFDCAQIAGILKREGVTAPGRGMPPAVDVLPTGVDDSFFKISGREQREGSILFVGAFAADFNVDSIVYFAREVFPLIRMENPEARLLIAGGDAPVEVRALGSDEGVEFLGLQNDLTVPLEEAAVFVVPLRFAGGIRIRTLEAMAMGKAIVTTSVGIRGIEAVDGRDLLIADGAEKIARAVLDLLADKGRRAKLGAAAREFAKTNYSMEAAGAGAIELFDRLAGPQD